MRRPQRRSRRQEDRLVQDLGGRRMPASGATPYAKDDVRVQGKARVEAKTTTRPSYRFDPGLFLPLRKRALTMGELPVFAIDLSGGKTRVVLCDTSFDLGISGSRAITTKTYLFSEKVISWWFDEAHPKPYLIELQFPSLVLYAMSYDTFLEAFRER